MKNWSKRSFSPQSTEPVGEDPPRQACGTVDAHVHVFPPELIRDRQTYLDRDRRFAELYAPPAARMVTAEDVVNSMDSDGVDLSVVFGFAFDDPGLCRMVNDYVLEAVRANPARLAGLACVSLRHAGAGSELERCLDAGFRGCGELALDPTCLDASPELAAVTGCLCERELPLLVHANEPVGHTYPGKGSFTPEACFALASAHPGLRLVLAHLGGGLFLYELMPEVRKALTHVWYDTAAAPYLYDPTIYSTVIAIAGVDKLIFGSDYPLLPPARYLAGLDGLPTDESVAVRSDNARRVFRL